jgi:Ca2+/Na+ antiporter
MKQSKMPSTHPSDKRLLVESSLLGSLIIPMLLVAMSTNATYQITAESYLICAGASVLATALIMLMLLASRQNRMVKSPEQRTPEQHKAMKTKLKYLNITYFSSVLVLAVITAKFIVYR